MAKDNDNKRYACVLMLKELVEAVPQVAPAPLPPYTSHTGTRTHHHPFHCPYPLILAVHRLHPGGWTP